MKPASQCAFFNKILSESHPRKFLGLALSPVLCFCGFALDIQKPQANLAFMRPLLLLFWMCASAAMAAEHPYNESADAKLDIQQALAAATNGPVLVVFGANWCGDCRALDAAMKNGASAGLLARDFKVVKVNV